MLYLCGINPKSSSYEEKTWSCGQKDFSIYEIKAIKDVTGGFNVAYVSRNSPISKVLLENMKDTNFRYILTVAYDPKQDGFYVQKIVKKGTWSYYDKDK